jgi:hypothetical protein
MREIERKYEAIEGMELLDPAVVPEVDTTTGPDEQILEAVYFDTADLRLLGAGVTLRRREDGSDAGWHLKLPTGKDSREELRLPLGGSPRRPPAELVALTRVYTRDAALAPVAELTTRRRRWVLADSTGRSLAELVDDHVSARTMGEQTTTVAWREVEVELGEQRGSGCANAGTPPGSRARLAGTVWGIPRAWWEAATREHRMRWSSARARTGWSPPTFLPMRVGRSWCARSSRSRVAGCAVGQARRRVSFTIIAARSTR